MSATLDGPGLYAAAQRSLDQSSQVSMADGHALLCAVQAVAQALLAQTAATVDLLSGHSETRQEWFRAVHPGPGGGATDDDTDS